MSQYKTIETQFKTLASLLEALEDLGYTGNQVQVAPNPKIPSLKMQGFYEIASQKVSVRLPLRDQGAYEDVGFYWDDEKKTYQAIISTHNYGENFGEQKLKQLKQRYAVSETKRLARTKGYTVQENRQPDGTIRMTLVHR
jgi:hypothetical protein